MINFLVASTVGCLYLALVWWWFRPEAALQRHVLKVFLLGMIICVPVGFFNTMWAGAVAPHLFSLSQVSGKMVATKSFYRTALLFLLVAPIEEIVKYFIVRTESYRLKAFDTVEEGVLLAMVSALGFATFENYHYMEQHGFALIYLRGFLCPPGHMLFSAFFGYYLGLAKTGHPRPRWLIAEGLVLASLAHGFYNASTGIHLIASAALVLSYLAYYLKVLRHEAHRPVLPRLFPAWFAPSSSGLVNPAQKTRRRRPTLPHLEGAKAEEVVGKLLKGFEALGAEERIEAARGASAYVDQRVYEGLKALLHDPVPEVRQAAVDGIAPLERELEKLYRASEVPG